MKLSNKEIFFTTVDIYYQLSMSEREEMCLRISENGTKSMGEYHVVMFNRQSPTTWELNFNVGYDDGVDEFYIEEAFGFLLDLEKISERLFSIIRDRRLDKILK